MRVWFLKETKSVCTSCATGCNIIVGSREDVVYRYVPRQNDAVNSCWMCDYGRLNYKWVGRSDRLVQVKVRRGGAPNPERLSWAAALQEIAAKLKAGKAGSLALVASARQCNEELWLLSKLASKYQALTDSIPRTGQADKLLLSADRNPNSLGAKLTGIAADPLGSRLARISEGIRTSQIRQLIVFGEDVTQHGISLDMLAKLDLFVVSDILPNATTQLAHYLLPGAAHLEKRGTFTNGEGRVQKFMKAVEPRGDSRPEWEFLGELLALLGEQPRFRSIEGLFNLMAEDVSAFNGLKWSELGDTGANSKL